MTPQACSLNCAQTDLLRMIANEPGGCVVYGRAYAATAEGLARRGLIASTHGVRIASMGSVETRPCWSITADGKRAAQTPADVAADPRS